MSKLCECGIEIEFAVTPNGKRIPLRKIEQVYRIENGKAIPMPGLHQSHYLDCPLAKKFSGKNR